MTRRKRLRSGVRGFIGTFSSRYSNYQGYWLFGHLLNLSSPFHIDLLSDPEGKGKKGAERRARQLAIEKFRDQLVKARVRQDHLVEATLILEKGEKTTQQVYGLGGTVPGFRFHLTVSATLAERLPLSEQITIFVAHYDLFSKGAHPDGKERPWWKFW